MRKVVASLFVSLDGVVGDPAGWQLPYYDEEMGREIGESLKWPCPRARSLFAGNADRRLGAPSRNSDYNCDQVVALGGVVSALLSHGDVRFARRRRCCQLPEATWTIPRCRTRTQSRHLTPRSVTLPRAAPARG